MGEASPTGVQSPGTHVLLSSTASDSHTWNLIFLQLLIEELGHPVKNLGACVPDDVIVAECMNLRPGLVVISSVNGHGYHDGLRLARALRRRDELAATPMIIGGKLGIGSEDEVAQTERLLSAGFTAVFADGTSLDSFQKFVLSLPAPGSGVTRSLDSGVRAVEAAW